MVSEFRKKKYLHVFNNFFDADKSGTVEKSDFTAVCVNLAKLKGYNPGEVTYELAKEALNEIWSGLVAQADSDGDGVVTADEFVKVWDDFAKNPAGAPQWQKLYCKAAFQFLDMSNDGELDAEEFSKVNEAFGLDKAKSVEAFNKMSNGKPKVNWDEFQKLFNEYFTSDNPSDPGNFVFGIRVATF